MIIQIQLTALMILASAAAVVYVVPTENASDTLRAITVITGAASLFVVFVTSLIRIWA